MKLGRNESELGMKANRGKLLKRYWLPPRDSNPDNLLQRQVS